MLQGGVTADWVAGQLSEAVRWGAAYSIDHICSF